MSIRLVKPKVDGAIDFEVRPTRSYCVECPRCSPERRKQNTKSLSVFRDSDGFIRVKCNHDSGCDYGTMTSFRDPEPDLEILNTTPAVEDILSPIETAITLPTIWNGDKVYWYKDVLGRGLFGVIRYKSKAFAPLVLLKNGEWKGGAGVKYPPGQALFGAEHLPGKTKVLIVEGEKAAEAGQKLYADTDIAVVSWRGGCNNVNNGAWALLKGKHEIILWPDNDTAGIAAMLQIAKLLPPSNVKILDVSHLPPKADVADDLSPDDIRTAFEKATVVATSDLAKAMTLDQMLTQNEFLNRYKLFGWPLLDDHIKLPPSGIVVVQARSGHGKSAFAVNLAHNFIKDGNRVVFLSYEMPASRVLSRFVRLNNPDLAIEDALIPEHIPDTLADAVACQQLQIYDQSAQLKADELISMLDSPEYNGALVVLDYLQIVPLANRGLARYEAIREKLIDPLRVVANNHGFIVLALSQLTPNYASPELDSPRECADIVMSAEMVLQVWNKDCFSNHPVYDFVDNNLAIHVVKNRDGESNAVFDCELEKGAYLNPKKLMTPKQVLLHLKSARNSKSKGGGGLANDAF